MKGNKFPFVELPSELQASIIFFLEPKDIKGMAGWNGKEKGKEKAKDRQRLGKEMGKGAGKGKSLGLGKGTGFVRRVRKG